MTSTDKLVFDIGFHNGDDTAFYLDRGYRVLAVEANPVLAERGRQRFAHQIAEGRLTILNIGIWKEAGVTLPFYVNDSDDGWSSFESEFGKRGGKYHEVSIPCATVGSLFAQHGVPWYLKVDIEGSDESVVAALQPDAAPQYFSCELGIGSTSLEGLRAAGYDGFKVINQETYTQSLPIFDDQILRRGLRKMGNVFPMLEKAIKGSAIRPKNILWDDFRERFPYAFSSYSTGPAAEETEGPWLNFEEVRSRLDYLFSQYKRYKLEESFWYDLHARHRTAASG